LTCSIHVPNLVKDLIVLLFRNSTISDAELDSVKKLATVHRNIVIDWLTDNARLAVFDSFEVGSSVEVDSKVEGALLNIELGASFRSLDRKR